MRLLDTATLQLKEFFGDATPPYAILSHTWEEDEVSLQALATARHNVPELAGHTKIRKCCEIAASDGFQYVWIDTCCIDKTNSTELSEAINSMYRWYEEAVVCYAYLADVYPTDVSLEEFYYPWKPRNFKEIIRFRERQSSANQFKTSKWFTRGWTLQELLAPSTVVFFNKTWEDIGSKRSLNELISDVTKIPLVALLKFDRTKHTIAQIMSWASNRRTTRVEDIAYSLLGLFGVHMPMIYGEGRNAFARLQREILKESTDQSIFAWAPSHTGEWEQYRGPFATSPAEFAVCGGVTHYHNPSHSEYSLTNKGLRIELPVLALSSSVLDDLRIHFPPDLTRGGTIPLPVIGFLNCQNEDDMRVIILLQQDLSPPGDYIRLCIPKMPDLVVMRLPADLQTQEIYVRNPPWTRALSKFNLGGAQRYYWWTAGMGGPASGMFSLCAAHELHISPLSPDFGGRWLWGGVVSEHENPRNRFVVVSGLLDGVVWLDMETEIGEEENIQDVLDCYDGSSYEAPQSSLSRTSESSTVRCARRRRASLDCLDRINKSIGNGVSTKVAVKKQLENGELIFVTTITLCYG